MEDDEKVEKYNLTIEDVNFDGVQVISLVDYPAIEEDFVYMGKAYKFQDINEEKRLVIGPAMIPDKDIVRYNWMGEKYFVSFDEETIRNISEKFMKEQRLNNTNVQHSLNVNNVSIIENWVIEDTNNDKANVFGFDLPKGTWMVSMKIDNDDVWNMVKSGEIKGFSIEGFFTNILVKNNQDELEMMKKFLKN